MEENDSVNVYMNGLTDNYSNFSGLVELAEPCPGISWFQFFVNTVVISLMCLLGLAGNTISILVLQKDGHNRVAVFLLQALSIADNSVLTLAFIALSIAYGLLPKVDQTAHVSLHPYIVKYLNPLGNIAQSTVIWLTVLLAVNRYIAICHPFTAKRWLTMRYARIQVAIVVTLCALLNAPRVLRYGSIPSSLTISGCNVTLDPRFNETDLGRNKDFERIYLNGIYTTVVLILPLVLLVGFNVPLIRQMQRSKRRMKRNSLSYRGGQENSITMVMVAIIAELIVCHAPDRVAMVVRLLWVNDDKDDLQYPRPLFFAVNITNLLVLFNSATDFIIYYVFRRRFRRILCSKLLCTTPDSNTGSPVQSEAGNGNAVCSPGKDSPRHPIRTPDGARKPERTQPFSMKDRYKLTKKRHSNQILLLKLHSVK